ncbi:MAG: hypothetical protein GF401_03405 [Chitinivibrionales bacterium]|nr:hypothetical protein [Chitinivibrionales bacterium]
MIKILKRIAGCLLLALCFCTESPFDASTDLGKEIVDDVDNSITDFEGGFDVVIDPMPTEASSFHTKNSNLFGLHGGTNRITSGEWASTGEKASAYLEFAFTQSPFDSAQLVNFQKVDSVYLVLKLDTDFNEVAFTDFSSNPPRFSQTFQLKNHDAFLSSLDTVPTGVAAVSASDTDSTVTFVLSNRFTSHFSDSLAELRDYLINETKIEQAKINAVKRLNTLNNSLSTFEAKKENVDSLLRMAAFDSLETAINSQKSLVDSLENALQDTQSLHKSEIDSLDSLYDYYSRKQALTSSELRQKVVPSDTLTGLTGDGDSIKAVIDTIRNKGLSSADTLILDTLENDIDSVYTTIKTIVNGVAVSDTVRTLALEYVEYGDLMIHIRMEVDPYDSLVNYLQNRIEAEESTLLEYYVDVNAGNSSSVYNVDSLQNERTRSQDSIAALEDSIEVWQHTRDSLQIKVEMKIQKMGFVLHDEHRLASYLGTSSTFAPYFKIVYSYAPGNKGTATVRCGYADYSVVETDTAGLNARPVASWASSRKAHFAIDFSRLWQWMDSVDSDLVLKAHLRLSIEDTLFLSNEKKPSFAFYFSGTYSQQDSLKEYFRGNVIQSKSAVYEIPIEDSLMTMYQNNRTPTGYLHLALLGMDEYWAQVIWKDTDIRLEAVLFENPK